MTEQTLAAEILRLQKLDLDEDVRRLVDEAAELQTEGRFLEAEALIENADARARHAQAVAGSMTA
jgi:hypothetical protein